MSSELCDTDFVTKQRTACLQDRLIQQKQKIILAAALSRNPELLFLDETTNAIDRREEQKILTKILNKNITLVLISHKLQNKELFDKIIKIENKKLIKLK